MLIVGLILLIAADFALSMLPGVSGAFVGIALWGAHMAATQGLFAKLVADHSPPALRGSAYGVFSLVTGIVMLAASVIAGLVWDAAGPDMTFLVGALFAGAALVGCLLTSFTERRVT